MTSTGHALVGALIAAKFQNPYIVLSLSLLSHYPADILPHWDVGTHIGDKTSLRRFIEGSVDIAIGLVLSFFAYTYLSNENNYLIMVLAIFFAQLPDWLSAPYTVFKMNIPMIKKLDDFSDHLHNKLERPWGIVTQGAAIGILYIILFVVF